jgi:hypothetical protein
MAEHTEEPLPGPSPEALLALRLIPKFGDALAQYVTDRHQRRLERAGEVVTTAAKALELDPAVLIERIIEDERLADLLNDAIQAAARSGLEAKRRALGKVLAQAVAGDDATVDQSMMLAASLAHVEAVHVRVMAQMFFVNGDRLVSPKQQVRRLAHKSGLHEDVVAAAVLQLQAWGLAEAVVDTTYSRLAGANLPVWVEEPDFQLTGYGLAVIGLLETPSSAQG